MSLCEIGGSYFVLDGNHCVSVYRYHVVGGADMNATPPDNEGGPG